MTIRAAVVGSPAKHSLSPTIHNAWLKAAGIDGEYGLFDIDPHDFPAFVERARAEGLTGVNVTLPFKEKALAMADEASPAAQMARAANLLVFNGATIFADNTDGLGLIAALGEQAPALKLAGAKAVVLGAGGAARGAVAALAGEGCEVVVVNRTVERAQSLVSELQSAAPRPVKVSTASLTRALRDAAVVINATSAGLDGADGGFELDDAPATAVVMDMVYKPLITRFLAAATAKGHPTVDGLAMLIGQARPSYQALFGQTPPAGVDVRALCLAKLEQSP